MISLRRVKGSSDEEDEVLTILRDRLCCCCFLLRSIVCRREQRTRTLEGSCMLPVVVAVAEMSIGCCMGANEVCVLNIDTRE